MMSLIDIPPSQQCTASKLEQVAVHYFAELGGQMRARDVQSRVGALGVEENKLTSAHVDRIRRLVISVTRHCSVHW